MQLQIMKTIWYFKQNGLNSNEFHFYFCSLQWPNFHVCNPQINCFKKKKKKQTKCQRTQHRVIEQLCGFHMYVGNMRGSLSQNFLSPL